MKPKENKEVKQKTKKELITQSDFADKCGVQRKTVYNWLVKASEDPNKVAYICAKNPYLRDNGIINFESNSYDEAEKIKAIELTILIKE